MQFLNTLLLVEALYIACAWSQVVSAPYKCGTSTCQNYTATYDDIGRDWPVTIENGQNTYGLWSYNYFNARASEGYATKQDPKIQPHSGAQYARANPSQAYYPNSAYYLFIPGTAYIVNAPSFYFACAQPGSSKAIPCTLTCEKVESSTMGYQQFKYVPTETSKYRFPMQLAQLSSSFKGLSDLKLSAVDANGTLVSLLMDDFKYIASSTRMSG